ncbi:NAD-dependent deacetylase [Angomonas deanei]|uniref:Sir2 family, putative n=1 Tax=Angomonas deanei TaxID=59799 RepID=A0A7G2C9J5_9TRYP|nr:NAD-dependent deacetylase [Angomonas deanei]CAD2215423.1 Sir2 family, putative [Angomonas deanei]|eukprot:EPY37348.1 NAD-dependent deacetylase [Angomonas deanei]
MSDTAFTDMQSKPIRAAAEALSRAKRVAVFTGAGMSAESGINTFRDPEVGVWKNKIALYLFGTPYGWRWTPGWGWSNYRRFHEPIFKAQPNAGHYALANMAAMLGIPSENVKIATQNVDYLHQRAGNPPEQVFEVHGSVFRHRCVKNGHPIDIPKDQPLPEKQPKCAVKGCGSSARPDAVLFTETLPEDQWTGAEKVMRELQRGDVLLVIGTTGQVYPAAGLPDMVRKGVTKIELNIEPSNHTAHMDIFVKESSAVSLPKILEEAKKLKS